MSIKSYFTRPLQILLFFLFVNLMVAQDLSNASRPNVLLVTVDDMNWNSVGAYGASLPNLTPSIDALAQEGMRFERAYVQAPNCSPSRSVFQTSLYPHQSGIRGFFYAKPNNETLPEILKANGYFTGVLNKAADSSLSPDFERYWDVTKSLSGANKRSAGVYGELLEGFLSKVLKEEKPFYCVINIADPHKPFYNDAQSKKMGFDVFGPSKLYDSDDIELPTFLPNHPKIKQEMQNYIHSVKRADDCFRAIKNTLNRSKFAKNTIVVFISDHGMPFPYAKSSLYENGLRTPWIVSWPNKTTPGSVNHTELISAIDFMPTILDCLALPIPEKSQGISHKEAILGEESRNARFVFGQFDENSGGIPRPSRTVISKSYGYIFNAWATGKYPFTSAASSHPTYKTMRQMAQHHQEVKERFDHWLYRSVEELYDYEKDPNALYNLIDNPAYSEVVDEMRQELRTWMKNTNDYLLPAFDNKENPKKLNRWMENQIKQAEVRTKKYKWKRGKNQSGSTKANKALFDPNSIK